MISHCISTHNNLPYLKLAIQSVRENSYYKDAPFIIHAENCNDGTDEWLKENKKKYNLEFYIDKNEIPLGIGGGMNFCADKVKTKYINFLHSDFYVSKNWDIKLVKIHEKHGTKSWIFSQRIQPNIFKESSRPGTLIVPIDEFGGYYDDFNQKYFLEYAQLLTESNNFEISLGEGVSGLILKEDWDYIGGNDPLFSPASWDDKDIFLRCLLKDFKLVLTTTSVVWHFGARGSHRLEENEGKTSQRQIEAERKNSQKWLTKWNQFPTFDQNGMIKKDNMSILDSYKEEYK
jgi:GT2 family glycosyltransferase|tara:strand:+ start:125 stop:991 length:867 start_codon:yes stop_codon:yes gene_type:complete